MLPDQDAAKSGIRSGRMAFGGLEQPAPRKGADRFDPGLSESAIAAVETELPVRAQLFGVCRPVHRKAWRGQRLSKSFATARQVSPVP